MYTVMYLQTTCVSECFITHFTGMCSFHSMYPLILFHYTMFNKCSTEGSLLQRKKEINIAI
jgi:hypothetical protein